MDFQTRPVRAAQTEKESLNKYFVICGAEQMKASNFFSRHLSRSFATRAQAAVARLPEAMKATQELQIPGTTAEEPDLHIAILPDDRSAFDLLTFSRQILKSGLPFYYKSIGVFILEPKVEVNLVETFSAAVGTRIFLMPEYGKRLEKRKPFQLRKTIFYGAKADKRLAEYGFATAEGTNLVRSLGFTPPNYLNPKIYGDKIRALAKENKFQVKFYSAVELKKMGAGAFTAVDRGDPNSGGGIYELSYLPKKSRNKAPIAFVGKGLCFDTGGYDVKTAGYMVTMKGDMQGSALALANMITAARLRLPLKMKAYLAVTENHISPAAYKPDEVVTALNGLTIEVVNTDAEGRMVLADALALASRAKPEMILDFATLTGTAVLAIGNIYGAAFSNREELHASIIRAGKQSGERVWTFPLDKDYGKWLESPVADTLQCTKGRSADHILAAFFLNRFVAKEIPWVHLDLSAADKEGGLAHVDSLFTGFGLRWTMEFLRSQFKLKI